MFEKNERMVLKSKLNLSGVGRLFGVSGRYVSQILNNKRKVNSELSLKIFNYLKSNIDNDEMKKKADQ